MTEDSLPESHNQIVSSLTKDLQAVTLANPQKIFLIWLIPSVVIITLLTLFVGLREDLVARLQDYTFLIAIIALTLGTLISGWLSIKISIPGSEPQKKWRIALIAFPLVLVAFISIEWLVHYSWQDYISGVSGGAPCATTTFAFSILPLLILSALTARLAPLRPLWAALLVSLSALFLASLGVQLHCSADNGCHLALWHYFPIFVASFLIAYPLQYILGKWKP